MKLERLQGRSSSLLIQRCEARPRAAVLLVGLVFVSTHLARSIHDDFYCNRRHDAATSLMAGGLAAQSVNILFQVCLPPSRLRAPVSLRVRTPSRRTFLNNAG